MGIIRNSVAEEHCNQMRHDYQVVSGGKYFQTRWMQEQINRIFVIK